MTSLNEVAPSSNMGTLNASAREWAFGRGMHTAVPINSDVVGSVTRAAFPATIRVVNDDRDLLRRI
jgi:hypothetical protein